MLIEEILHEIQRVETVEEEEQDSVDEIATKPTPLEIRQSIETRLNFSMFTENGEIGTMVMKELKGTCNHHETNDN